MYTFTNNTIEMKQLRELPVNCEKVNGFVAKVENIVAEYFDVSPEYLRNFAHDSDAKLMCCFVLQQLREYKTEDLASMYKIHPGFLQKKLNAYYKLQLLDDEFMNSVAIIQSKIGLV